jgi:hypothetical protein
MLVSDQEKRERHGTGEQQDTPGRKRRFPAPSRSFRLTRCMVLLVLAMFGLHLLAGEAGVIRGATPSNQHGASAYDPLQAHSARSTAGLPTVGLGAGAALAVKRGPNAPALCLNPLDVTCWLQSASQWLAQQIVGALQPVVAAILNSPLNILTQTPPADTYQNSTVMRWFTAFLDVVDLALASLIVVGGYNVIVGRGLGLPHSQLAEFLPRLLLAFGAAHFGLFFLGLFIDLENALCSVATNLASTTILTSLITNLFQLNLVGEGLLVVMLAVILGVMAILLGAQMAVRLALLWVLLVLAGPGLACFALPQTTGFGRLWLSLTASTVLVQFFQVVALCLGGTLLTALGGNNLFGVGDTLATLMVCIAMLYLVLRIPGIVHRYAIRPKLDASAATAGTVGEAAGFAADVAPRLLALL